jgi:CDP-diacylglycerol--glycerol-3-phosphate 3-phosphatidyltransferase
MEEFIVEELYKALKRSPDLKVTILLDHGRGLRIENGKNSLEMLRRLIIQTYPHSKNIKLAFFSHPKIGTIHNFLPGIVSEISGVLHSKLLVFDSNTIITGANLSHNYFTNRQDRYFIIQECEPFSDYCEDYINSLCNVSYTANSMGELFLPQHKVDPIKEKVNYTNNLLQQFKMFKYENRVKIVSGADLNINEYFNNLEKYNNNYRYRPNYENLIEFNSEKKQFLKSLIDENKEENLDFLKKLTLQEKTFKEDEENSANKVNSEDFKEQSQSNIMKKPSTVNKVLIFPSFQFSNIKQNDDQEILKELLTKDYFKKIRISSGYLNLCGKIINYLKDNDYEIDVITSSPQANSFYKAGFLKKNIPYLYRVFELNLLKTFKNKSNFSLFEFYRQNWSFHSKGIWFYEKEKEYPTMTVIGSSNYSK